MAGTIKASQISNDSTSWYQRLRTVQGRIRTSHGSSNFITKTADPNIASGSAAKAADMNAFITALKSVQSNPFLALAAWSSYPVNNVSAGTTIKEQGNIDLLLTSLESICSNYSTNTTNSYSQKANSYNSTYTQSSGNSTNSRTTNSTNSVCTESCVIYSYTPNVNSTYSNTSGNSTNNYGNSTYNQEYRYNDGNFTVSLGGYQTYTNDGSEVTQTGSSYKTEAGGISNAGTGPHSNTWYSTYNQSVCKTNVNDGCTQGDGSYDTFTQGNGTTTSGYSTYSQSSSNYTTTNSDTNHTNSRTVSNSTTTYGQSNSTYGKSSGNTTTAYTTYTQENNGLIYTTYSVT